MNELQRQHYLLALGMDTYMPRWQLPFAPVSVACELPAVVEEKLLVTLEVKSESTYSQSDLNTFSQVKADAKEPVLVSNLIDNIFEPKKAHVPKAQPIGAAAILAQLDSKPANIDAFSLSIWRPFEGIMIVDSRNTKLALPTELLLNNILRSVFSSQSLKPQEEVLRWPMIENSFTKRTVFDARIELQTWLFVQNEIRPIQYLWLMGSNAASYLLPEDVTFTNSIFQSVTLADSTIQALVVPAINDLLQNPTYKKQLFSAISQYQSAQK